MTHGSNMTLGAVTPVSPIRPEAEVEAENTRGRGRGPVQTRQQELGAWSAGGLTLARTAVEFRREKALVCGRVYLRPSESHTRHTMCLLYVCVCVREYGGCFTFPDPPPKKKFHGV